MGKCFEKTCVIIFLFMRKSEGIKILHVINSMNMGGAESLLTELAPVQREMGNQVDILELKEAENKNLIKALVDKGISVRSISKKRSVRNPMNIFSLIPYLKNYDIIHVHLFPAQYWVAIAKILSFSNVPLVTTEHSTNNKRRSIGVFKYIDSFIYKQYKEVMACADKAKETFLMRFPKVKCVSIPNGVNISKYKQALPYSKQELLGVSDDIFVVTMVARFIYPKRQDTLVEAISFLPENFHAVFVGGNSNDDGLIKVQSLAKKLNVIDRCHFLYIRSDVHRILKTSDVIAMSSEYEGLSLSSIEGMASGRPFVASNVNGLREIVKGVGTLFECGNAKELSDLILRLYFDSQYYNSIVEKCLEKADEYDINIVTDRYIEEYIRNINK